MRTLDTLTVRGFKSIRSLEDFRLSNLNVLIGGNGAGKSNIIDLFRMISAMMRPNGLREFVENNADSYLFGGPKQTQRIEIRLKFGQNGYDFDLAPTEDGAFLVNNEKRYYFSNGKPARPLNLGSGNFDPALLLDKDSEGYDSPHGASWYTYNAINSWQIYHFYDTSSRAGMRRLHDQGHKGNLFGDASNIAPFLLHLRDKFPGSYREIIDAIQLVTPFFDDFVLEPSQNENLRLNWRQKGLNDYPMRPSQLSDGSIRFICLATALLQPNPPATIIIDEPELGLHPQAVAILAELIRSAAKRTEIIISTQSPSLIDGFSIDDIIVTNRKEGATVFERLTEDDFTAWLENYSVGDLWAKNVISGGPSHE